MKCVTCIDFFSIIIVYHLFCLIIYKSSYSEITSVNNVGTCLMSMSNNHNTCWPNAKQFADVYEDLKSQSSSSSSRSPTRPVQQWWWSWWSSSGPPSPHIISGEAELLMATVRFIGHQWNGCKFFLYKFKLFFFMKK